MLSKGVSKQLRPKIGSEGLLTEQNMGLCGGQGHHQIAEACPKDSFGGAWRDKDQGKTGAALNVLADLCVNAPVRQRSLLLTMAFVDFWPQKSKPPRLERLLHADRKTSSKCNPILPILNLGVASGQAFQGSAKAAVRLIEDALNPFNP